MSEQHHFIFPKGGYREDYVEAAVRNLVQWRLGDRHLDWLAEAETLLKRAQDLPPMFEPPRERR